MTDETHRKSAWTLFKQLYYYLTAWSARDLVYFFSSALFFFFFSFLFFFSV
jgi:hypothetical protein